jgi:membrane fusion protein (multidrug efflux system)
MKYVKICLLIITATLISACGNKNSGKNEIKKNPPVPVEVLIAANEDFPARIEVNGDILPEEMVDLHPEISGRVTYLNFPEGANVKQGMVLARINDAELQAQLQQQKVQLELAQKTEQRLRKLLSVNGVDQATYDAALSQVNLYEANINVISAQIDKTVIKVPFSGKLGLRLISEGAYVTPNTLIGTLQQTSKLKIDFNVPETYASMLSIGKIIFMKTGTSDELISATVIAMEPQVNAASRSMKVRAKTDDVKLIPGGFVKVYLDNNIKGIVVPTHAIIPDAQSNQLIIIKKGKPVFKNVETGVRTADVVEITNGIASGDSVVVSGILFVRPNSLLKIKSAKTIDEMLKKSEAEKK